MILIFNAFAIASYKIGGQYVNGIFFFDLPNNCLEPYAHAKKEIVYQLSIKNTRARLDFVREVHKVFSNGSTQEI